MTIRNLQEENAKLTSRHEVLKNKCNHLEQYGKGSNTEVPGIPNLIGDNELEYLLIKIMKVIDIEVSLIHSTFTRDTFNEIMKSLV